MIAGFLWFQGTFPQLWYYTSPGKEEYSARLFRSEVGSNLIKAVYEMIDKRAISPVTALEFTVTVSFLGLLKKK